MTASERDSLELLPLEDGEPCQTQHLAHILSNLVHLGNSKERPDLKTRTSFKEVYFAFSDIIIKS